MYGIVFTCLASVFLRKYFYVASAYLYAVFVFHFLTVL